MTERAPRIIAIIGALAFLAFGLWALVDPRGFFDGVAVWPPFNKHFIHDIGAFQIGLGLTLLLAVVQGDALFVALAGVGGGAAVHAYAHWIDQDLGGKSSDPIVMTLLAVILLTGALLRRRGGHRTSFRR